jgi:GGDEF domain-containing protein
MTINPQYSHNGLRDDLTHCTAPPLFYAHVDRMISGSKRNLSPFSLIALTLSDEATSENVIALAHSISTSMRHEDLCGRLGRFQFIIALAGDLQAGGELSKRIQGSFDSHFSVHVVQWRASESLLELFYRLDTLSESQD